MLSKRLRPLALILLAILLVYSNSFRNSFHFDDVHTVTDNPAVRSLHELPRILSDPRAFSVLPANQTYRPVVTASLALDYALGHGYNPLAFHLGTFLWFLTLVALLAALVEHLLDRTAPSPANRWLALGTAAWFGLHPVMAETVNYVIQRGDLYCTLGCVAALWLFARWPGLRRTGLYLLPLALALLSKPPAAVFPALLALYVFFFAAPEQPVRQRARAALLAAGPSLLLTIALLALQAHLTPPSFAPSIVSPAAYRLTQPFVWMRYATALFLPLHLNVDTDLQPFHTLTGPALAGFLFLGVLLFAILWSTWQRHLAPIAFGLLWFALTLLPTSLYTLSEVENDHRMFFAFPGLMLAIVWCLRLLYLRLASHLPDVVAGRWLHRATFTAVFLCLAGYAFGAHRRNEVWRTEASLWADDVAKSPHNGRGLMIYGLTRMNAGDLDGALALFTRAAQDTPNYATLEINLGIVNGLLADRGETFRNALAESHFRRALRLAPQDDAPPTYFGRWLLTHGRVTDALGQLRTAVALNGQRLLPRDLLLQAEATSGDDEEAHELALETLRLDPHDEVAAAVLRGRAPGQNPELAGHINASLAAYRRGAYDQAVAEARQALALDPRSAAAWNNLGAGEGALGRWEDAIAGERQALALDPQLTIAGNNLRMFLAQGALAEPPARTLEAAGWVDRSLALYTAGKFEESLAASQHALALNPRLPEAWNNLAAADASLHRWEAAARDARHALALRPDFPLAQNNLAWALQGGGQTRSFRP